MKSNMKENLKNTMTARKLEEKRERSFVQSPVNQKLLRTCSEGSSSFPIAPGKGLNALNTAHTPIFEVKKTGLLNPEQGGRSFPHCPPSA